MRLCLFHVLALFSAQAVCALHESDVGLIDWYKRLIGVPLAGAVDTAPRFLHSGNESLVLTATANNVLAALHPRNGSVAWRFLFDPEDRINAFHTDDTVITTLSGQRAATLRYFDALTGHLISEQSIHPPQEGIVSEPLHFGRSVAYVADKPNDVLVLTKGYQLAYIDGHTGEVKWEWTATDQGSLVTYTKIFSTSHVAYVIGVSKSLASYTLHITALSSSTGQVLNEVGVPSSIANPLSDTIMLSIYVPHQYRPRIVWLEKNQIKSKALTPDLKNPVGTVKDAEFDKLLDVGLSAYGHFVGLKKGEPARVLKMAEDGTSIKLWGELEKVSQAETSEMVFGGGVDKEKRAHIARVFWSRSLRKGIADIFSTATAKTQRYTFPFDLATHGSVAHVTLTVSSDYQLVITTSTGAVQLWSIPFNSDASEMVWNREEALSTISASEFIELPEQVSVTKLHDKGFGARLLRQLVEAQNLPRYLFNFAVRFATGSYPSTIPSPAHTASMTLARDPFGFRQLIVAATDFGRVYAIDTANGEIVWSRILGLGWAGEPGKKGNVVGGRVDVVKVFAIKPVGSGTIATEQVTKPEVVLVAQRTAHNTLVDTVVFHVDAMTGADVHSRAVKRSKDGSDLLQGLDVIQGVMLDAFLLQNETRAVVMLDEFLQVYLYPENDETQSMFARVAPSLSLPLTTSIFDQEGGKPVKKVVGHSLELNTDLSHRYIAYPTWSLTLPRDENLHTLIPFAKGPVASHGKVLGNRTTLYKYLNARAFGVLTEPVKTTATASGDAPTCGLYIVDGVKGTIVYHVVLPSVTRRTPACDVRVSLTENWLVYHYYDEGETKGWRTVSVELYEGMADQKTGSADMSSYDQNMRNVTTFERAYVFSHGITAIATTSTKFGITSKDIIVATNDHKIHAISRRLLDPRRPKRKPTSEEQEEMLIEYDPVVPLDPKQIISHTYEVAQVRRIATSPALLESTSLVFAYGLDLFLTRVSPSGTFDVLSESFNKPQLVFTVLGLLGAIVVTRPMVRRKMLHQKWYQ
ncbi:hypothetical protein AX14_004695 [Amanita brunnescens Koide BX004]|nr:hypothetical protein AX14_004695 [Amanita brunnescens Koide BX004]